jgi:hypothetical protein
MADPTKAYLVYLVNRSRHPVRLKINDILDQKKTPLTPKSLTIDIGFPKLDVAGSNPVSRSIFSIT